MRQTLDDYFGWLVFGAVVTLVVLAFTGPGEPGHLRLEATAGFSSTAAVKS